jgi:hypothetical protein
LAVVFLSACSNPIGEKFADVGSIEKSRTWSDWVVVGRFGPTGPFVLTEVTTCEVDEPCTFSHNGQGHSYDGFDGYSLTVLRLEAPDGQVSHVVLRSKQTLYDDNARTQTDSTPSIGQLVRFLF